VIIIKSAAKKTLIGTLGAAALFVGGTQVAQADSLQIQSGDTVWAYSQKYHVSIDSIIKANKLADANLIVAGQSLNIPGVQTGSVSAASSAVTTSVASTAVTSTTATSATVASSATASSAVATSSAVVASSAVATSSAATSSVAASSAATTQSAATQSSTTTQTGTVQASATTQSSSTTVARSTQQSTAPAATSASTATGNWNAYLGQAYSYGNLDCSGLVQRVYGSRVNGRTTYTQQTTGAHNYNVYSAPKGALVFFGSDSAPYHVGISNGDGTFTHAPKTGDVVKVTSMKYYTPSYYVMPR
jgi:cell wall-associated NlpC family hydrolase